MCGIIGTTDLSSKSFEKNALKALNEIRHRGPDNQGTFRDSEVFLGHTRLAIVDLSTQGDQPIYYSDFVLVFNGELYNYIEIKEDLVSKNIEFNTNSDGEVFIKAFSVYGTDIFNSFDGPFAFILYNKVSGEIWFGRDAFGEKQLFFSIDDNNIFISSTIQALRLLKPEKSYVVDDECVNEFIHTGMIGRSEKTVYKEIKKCEPGCVYQVNKLNDKLELSKKHFSLQSYCEKNLKLITNRYFSDRFHETFKYSIEKRLRVDVPYTLLLSGGIDSSYLLCVLVNELKIKPVCYTLLEEGHPDIENVRHLTDHFSLELILITPPKDFSNFYIEALEKLDVPIFDAAYFSLYYIISHIPSNYKVIFCGDGADELFLSYSDARLLEKTQKYYNILFLVAKLVTPLIPRFRRGLLYGNKNTHKKWEAYWQALNAGRELYDHEKNVTKSSLTNLSERLNIKSDRAGMAFSKELRTPFLNKELFSLCENARFSNLNISSKQVLIDYVNATIGRNLNLTKRGFNSGGMKEGFKFLGDTSVKSISQVILAATNRPHSK